MEKYVMDFSGRTDILVAEYKKQLGDAKVALRDMG